MKQKETPNPSRLRGRGVEVSKTLFYSADTIIYVLSGKQCYTITNKNYRKAHLPLAVMSTGVSYLLIKVLVYHEKERLTIIIDMV